jgi:hypothetical protein
VTGIAKEPQKGLLGYSTASGGWRTHNFGCLAELAKDRSRSTEFSSRPGRIQVEPRDTSPKGSGYQRGLFRLNGVPDDVAEMVEHRFMGKVDNLEGLTRRTDVKLMSLANAGQKPIFH